MLIDKSIGGSAIVTLIYSQWYDTISHYLEVEWLLLHASALEWNRIAIWVQFCMGFLGTAKQLWVDPSCYMKTCNPHQIGYCLMFNEKWGSLEVCM